MEKPEGLTERQILAAQSLAGGLTLRDAARRSNCSVEGIKGWKKRRDFMDAVWAHQQELFQQTFGVTTTALPLAISKLTEIVQDRDPEINLSVKVQACKILIDAAQKQYETRAIERRIEHLESYANRADVTVEAESVRELPPRAFGGGGKAQT